MHNEGVGRGDIFCISMLFAFVSVYFAKCLSADRLYCVSVSYCCHGDSTSDEFPLNNAELYKFTVTVTRRLNVRLTLTF